jgi:glycosyltransferase involved in cell wall biosynthesis
MAEPRIAFVIDALPGLGGSERVLIAALSRYPDAAIYTLVYNTSAFVGTLLEHHEVRTSWVERLPFSRQRYRSYLPLFPLAIGHLDLRKYETIISVHYAVAHGVRAVRGQKHLSYVCTPLRYAWRESGSAALGPPLMQKAASLVFHFTRRWDQKVSRKVDSYGAVSRWAAENVRKAFAREARVIYPPVDTQRFHPAGTRGEHFLVVSRLVKHKRVDIVVEAFSRLGLPLLVVGEGPERARLERQAGANIRFLGHRPDLEVAALMDSARAFVHAGEEDFGIALVEAQAAGCPVIAYAGGAAPESVSPELRDLMFGEQTPDSLLDAISRFQKCEGSFSPGVLTAHAANFRLERFQDEFCDWVTSEGSPEASAPP